MIAPRLGRWTLLAALLLVASCTDTSNAPSGRGLPVSFSVFSGNGQNGTVGQELPQPIKVLATDVNNQPIANQVVNFVVTAGGGSVFAGTALTNVNGIAAEVWRLGTVAGSVQTVEVRAVASDGTKQVFGVFTANALAGAPDTIVINGGDNQSAPVNAAVAIDPSVRLADQYGNPVPGHSVTFLVLSGGGGITGSPALSNSSGIATVGSWSMGPTAGTNTLRATAAGLPSTPVVFTATGQAVSTPQLAITTQPAVNGQSGVVLNPQPVLQLQDNQGQPLHQANVAVTASINSGGGTLGGTVTVNTDINGVVTFTNLSISGLVGPRTLAFNATGVTGVTSGTVNLAAGLAAQIAVNDGNGQSANAGSALSTAPSVIVTDGAGNPVAGVSVTFIPATGGGSVTGGGQTTDAFGVARVGSWTLGPTSGSNTLSATATGSGISGNPVTITATALGNFWMTRASMPTPRRFTAFGVINGLLYVAGGKNASLTVVKTLEIYNPATNTWTIGKGMNSARVGAAYGVINGLLYVAGGTSPTNVDLATVESYNPATNTWTNRASMPAPRNFGASAVVNGILYVAAGGTSAGQTNLVYAYDPVSNTWSTKASLPAVRNDAVGAAVGNLFYVIGGQQNNTNDGALQVYNPATDTWSQAATMGTPRFHTNAVVYNGLIYVAGGLLTGAIATPVTEYYDPASNTWTPVADMPTGRSGAAIGLIGGILYVAGGSANSNVLGSNEAYVP
ncbi:MAG TPA: kelch repeat-containing protein [Gemmatimonadales bacterium]|jgi:N-acetylneuraminic acid mutarotase|nr:kelch repeat-containing protein [Gemmatimonadales bacterium]